MPIPAHFEDLPIDPLRPRAARRQLRLESRGATASGETARVLIHNISATGLLIESPAVLAQDERIELALPEVGTATAHVVWMSERFYGCRFETPLPASALGTLELYAQVIALPAAGPAAGPASGPSSGPASGPAEAVDTLPVRIARLRKEQGLTLEALAALVNVSKPTVWAWEQGKSRPAPERLAALARLLGVAEDELLTGRDGAALAQALAQARAVVAEAFGVDPARVKVSIEL